METLSWNKLVTTIRPQFTGMRVIYSPHAYEEVRLFPASRHRSARILKKLIKRYGAEVKRTPTSYLVGSGADAYFVMHTSYEDRMRRELSTKLDNALTNAITGIYNT